MTPTLREAAQQVLKALALTVPASDDEVIKFIADRNAAFDALQSALAAPAAPAEPVAVPAGYALVRTPITDDMHVAAAKVLSRAHGLEGTPQRMLDAMIAAAPPAPAAAPAGEPAACISRTQGRIYAQLLPAGRSLPLGTSLYPQQSAAMFQPAPARQEPLTEEQVRRGWSNISLHPYVEGRFIDGVRFAERAHGITAAPAEGGA